MAEGFNVGPYRSASYSALALLILGALSAVLIQVPGAAVPPVPPPVYAYHDPIVISGDEGFTPANGVVRGSGTETDPFRISGWDTASISVQGTTAHFVIADAFVHRTGPGAGIRMSDLVHGAVDNTTIEGMQYAIDIGLSSEVRINDTAVSSTTFGILLVSTDRVAVENSSFSGISGWALTVYTSTNATVVGNTFEGSGVYLYGTDADQYASHEIQGNTVNRDPIRYHTDCNGLTIEGEVVGQLIVARCADVRVTNLTVTNTFMAVQLAFVERASVTGNSLISNGYGLELVAVSNATISNNNASGNRADGIRLYGPDNVTVSDNEVRRNLENGISAYGAVKPTAIVRNNVSENSWGLMLFDSTEVRVFHNNVIDNAPYQAYQAFAGGNVWDAGYPGGGNHWSDYRGSDDCRGPAQDICTGPDGIGDEPYMIDPVTQDRYPWMTPFPPSRTPVSARFALYSDALAGWGFSPSAITNPGPTMIVTEGDRVTIRLRATDGLVHSWFVDYDNDTVVDPGEPSSPNFRDTDNVTYEFTPDRIGTFPYRCRFHPTTMVGPIDIRPREVANMPPTARIVVDRTIGNGTSEFAVDAGSSSDPEDAPAVLEVRWDWDSDGVWDTGWSTTKTASHMYGLAGVYVITVEVRDAGGLSDQAMATVTVDTAPPVTTLSITGTASLAGWYRSAVNVTLTATDDRVGADRTSYRVDGSAWVTYATPFMLTNGAHTLEVRSVDRVGNEETTQTRDVRVDTIRPTLTLSHPAIATVREVWIPWNAEDSGSGIDRFEVSVDGVIVPAASETDGIRLSLSDGEHSIRVVVYDVAGNAFEGIARIRVDTNVFSLTGPNSGLPTFGLVAAAAIATFLLWRRAKLRRRGSPPSS